MRVCIPQGIPERTMLFNPRRAPWAPWVESYDHGLQPSLRDPLYIPLRTLGMRYSKAAHTNRLTGNGAPASVRVVTVAHAIRPWSWTRSCAARPLLPGIAFLLLLLGHTPLVGTAAGGTVMGIVRDASERPLAGSAVRLETSDGHVLHRTSTDAQGRFTFPDVPVGHYAVIT